MAWKLIEHYAISETVAPSVMIRDPNINRVFVSASHLNKQGKEVDSAITVELGSKTETGKRITIVLSIKDARRLTKYLGWNLPPERKKDFGTP